MVIGLILTIAGLLFIGEFLISLIDARQNYAAPWLSYFFSHIFGIGMPMFIGFIVRMVLIIGAVVCICKGIPIVF